MSQVTLAGRDFGTPTRRARYLAGELRRRVHLFTEYGSRLVEWLTGALESPSRAAAGRPLHTVYQVVEPAGFHYLPDQGRLIVAVPNPLRLLWLNASSWLALSLCDGRDAEAIHEGYVTAVAHLLRREVAERQVNTALSELVAQGLVKATATSPPGPGGGMSKVPAI